MLKSSIFATSKPHMMKRALVLISFSLLMITAKAQNLQLHYDFGEDRKYPTTTFELFKPDKLGSTFLFVDMDYNAGDVKGVSSAYWEIARSFRMWKAPFAAHFEYNGGFLQWKDGDYSGVVQINNAWLAGVEYIYNDETFSKGLTLMALYKYIQGKHDASFQLTGVWYINFLKNKMTFSGFADYWREDNFFQVNSNLEKTKMVFLAEPQLWYNFSTHFSLGSELEFSNNFGGNKGFMLNPTAALKWRF